MILLPAIDLYENNVVRLLHGDYRKMTVYSDDPLSVARSFRDAGAVWLHTVDLEGARTGGTPHAALICRIKEQTGLRVEVGGGIRSFAALRAYFDAGIDRVILGTAALEDRPFLLSALEKYGDRIAVGVDLSDGRVAVRGWTATGDVDAFSFLSEMRALGVSTVICTDIARDGAMRGANRALYAELNRRFDFDLIASGGVSTVEDIRALRALGVCGAIVGRALYTGDLSLETALEAAK